MSCPHARHRHDGSQSKIQQPWCRRRACGQPRGPRSCRASRRAPTDSVDLPPSHRGTAAREALPAHPRTVVTPGETGEAGSPASPTDQREPRSKIAPTPPTRGAPRLAAMIRSSGCPRLSPRPPAPATPDQAREDHKYRLSTVAAAAIDNRHNESRTRSTEQASRSGATTTTQNPGINQPELSPVLICAPGPGSFRTSGTSVPVYRTNGPFVRNQSGRLALLTPRAAAVSSPSRPSSPGRWRRPPGRRRAGGGGWRSRPRRAGRPR